MPATSATSSLRPFLFLASLAIILALLYWARIVLVPVALAVLLSFILNPIVVGLQRRHLGRVPSVILVATMALLLVVAVGLTLTVQISQLTAQLPQYQENISKKIASLRDLGKSTSLQKLETTVKHIEEKLQKGDGAEPPPEKPVPVRVENSNYLAFGQYLGPAADLLATTGLVMVLMLFMLIYREDLRGRLVRLIGHGRLVVTTRALDEAAQRISRYLLMQVMVNTMFGAVLAIILALIGVPYAVLWGFLAAVMRFIPFVGSWLVAAFLVAFSVAVFPGWWQPLLVLAGFLILEVLTYQVLEPLLFGTTTGITPVALLLAAAFWTWLWGPVGLALSTPLTACLVVLGKYVPHLEFLDILLGDDRETDPEISYYQRLLARDQDEAVEVVETYLQSNPAESLCDAVLIPALVLAKRDRASGLLGPDDDRLLQQVTRDVVDEILAQRSPQHADDPSAPAEVPTGPRPLVLCCPARDDADELSLQMFRRLLEGSYPRADVEVLSAKSLAAEVVAQVEDRRPVLVCVAALPPGGLAQVRYLCKRLRSAVPEQRILVGRWGETPEDLERSQSRLASLGADHLSATLLEARSYAVPLLKAPPSVHAAMLASGAA